MKTKIVLLAVFLTLGLQSLSAQDQADVSNDNLVNYFVRLHALKWKINNDGDAEESAWRWKWRKNQSYAVNCSESQWQVYDYCYTSTTEHNTWLFPNQKVFDAANVPLTDQLSFIGKGHENDGANDCFYDFDLFNEDNDAWCWQNDITITDFAGRNQWGSNIEDRSGGKWGFEFEAVYRYVNGDAFNRPLTFGTLTSGVNKYHFNSNRSRPSGANSNCGYSTNLYSDAAADVVYSFTINAPMNVTISTDHSSTNFDTEVYLFNNSNGFIALNDDGGSGTTSTLTRFLCAGTYKVLVGGHSSNTGDFRLRVFGANASAVTSAGSISGQSLVCQGENIPNIASTAAGTVSCGNRTYQWQKWNGSAYVDEPGATGETYNPNAIMGTTPQFYTRITKDQYGFLTYSNVVTISRANASTNPGSVSFSGNSTIPGGTDPGSFSSVSNATASPAIKAVFWEKQESTDGGISWSGPTSVTSETAINQSYNVPALSTTTRFRRTVVSTCDNTNNPVRSSTNYLTINVVPADGVISGQVANSLGTGVSGVTVTAMRTTNVSGGTTANGMGSDVTDGNGNYAITGLYYGGTSADFTVTPSKTNHEFNPTSRSVTVNSSNPVDADFTDISVFTVSGNIKQFVAGDNCNVAGVKVDLIFNGQVVNQFDNLGITDENGNYAITVQSERTYTLEPKLEGRTFLPAGNTPTDRTFVADSDKLNMDFEDITKYSLQGFVLAGAGSAAGCEQFMGTATITLTDEENCFEITGTTDGTGFFQITGIPAKVYNVKVTDLNPITGYADRELEIKAFFDTNGKVIDLGSSNQNEDFYFHAKPVIVVEGMPTEPCTFPYPVLAQSETTSLTIRVFEEGTTCPVDTGTISINDQIGDMGADPITFQFKGGEFEYPLKAGNPNIIAPHLKNITISAIDTFEKASENYNQFALVTGGRPREQNFSTQSPQLPLLILRDPPGDASYSYFEESTTTETATRFFTSDAESQNIWTNVRIGLKFDVSILGLGTETAFWGDVGGAYEVNSTNSSAYETILSTTSTTRFETTNNDIIQGSDGDVFVGAAMAFAYAISDEVLFDETTCQVLLDKNLVIANEGLASEFIFTEKHIKEQVIPELKSLRDSPGQTPAQIDNYNNQILVWEQMLQRNDDLKAAATDVEVVQFGGNSPREKSTTTTSTEISTIEFGMEINTEIASEMGFEIAGSGLSGGLITNFKMETGESTTNTNINSVTTGYRLEDDDPLDEFTVQVKTDPVYKTPVFETLGGQSECPHEPGTNAREAVQLRADNPIQAGIPAGGTATFTLFAGNISETDETRTYSLRFKQVTNIGGAAITVGGSGYTVPLSLDDIGPGSEVPITVTVTRGVNSPIYSYEGLEFELFSACDDSATEVPDANIIATVALSAFFQSPCSDINLVEPLDGYIVTQADDNVITFRVDGYDVNNLDKIEIEYTPSGQSNWLPAVVLESNELNDSPFGTEIPWSIINVEDGDYDIRIKVICGLNTSYSDRISGKIDRSAPSVLGTPEPGDDNYVLGDEISVSFDEILNCNGLSATDVQLTRAITGEVINAQLSCFSNKVIITPNVPITTYDAEKFEVTLSNVADAYGNAITAPVVWEFFVGGDLTSLDFDGDGVPNPLDRCPGFDDSVDGDNDGIPDHCDKCPTEPNPGIHFDGDDRITASSLTEIGAGNAVHTIEAWIYLDRLPTVRSWPLLLGQIGEYNHHWLINPDGSTQLGVWSGEQFGPILEPQKWYHIAISNDGGNMMLYINGFKAGEKTSSFNFGEDNNLYLGQIFGAGFQGKMDEVRLWSTARTQSEIGTYMDKEIAGDMDGLVLYYNFNEGVPNADNTAIAIIEDQTSNNYNGAILNLAKTGTTSNWVNGAPVDHLDSNNDGVGDICEPDTDMDGVPDYADNCPGSDDNIDTDMDGYPDGCDNCPDAANPAMDFDGEDDYVAIPSESTFDFTNAMTVEAWFKVDEFDKEFQTIIAKGDAAWRIARDGTSNTLAFATNGVSNFKIVGSTNVNDGKWHHVAGVYNGSYKYLYIDGVLDASAEATGDIDNGSEPVFIGENAQQTGRQFDGQIDEVRIWDYARTEAQIQSNLNKELMGDELGLVTYYDFNEGLPNQDNTGLNPNVFDKSGNSYTGTMNNMAQDGNVSNWVEGPNIIHRDKNNNGIGDACDDCEILNANLVVSSCNNGIYNFTINVDAVGNGSTFYVDGDLTSGGYSYHQAITFSNQVGTVNFTIHDTYNPSCTYQVTVTPPSGCEGTGTGNYDCSEADITLENENLASGTYSTKLAITSESIIPSGNDVEFTAKQFITLKTGFHAVEGSTFTARIDNCTPALSDNGMRNEEIAVSNTLVQETDLILRPNPTRVETTIQFYLPETSNAILEVYNSTGNLVNRLVENSILGKGEYSFSLRTDNFQSGIYFIILRTNNNTISKKLIVLE